MLNVYEFRGFPNPARVRIAVAEKHATDQVAYITVDVPAGEHRLPAFLAKNPSGTVPALELEDGTVISECTAIIEYLDQTFPGPSLVGETATQRALVHMMQRRAEVRLLDAATAYFHHATPGLGPTIELYQNPGWGEHQLGVLREGMRYFHGVLQQTPFVAGEVFSMADITVFAALSFAAYLKLELPHDCRALGAWREQIAARPSVAG